MDTGSSPGVKSGRGVTLIPYPLLEPWSRKSRAILLLSLWAVRPVQSLSACTRVHIPEKPQVTAIWARRHNGSAYSRAKYYLPVTVPCLERDP